MNDNEVKDEKSVDVFSLKHLESQKIILPQDLFRKRFTWVRYEIYKSLAFRIWLLLWLPLSVWWKMSSNWIYPFIASLLLLFPGLIFAPFIHFLFRKRALSKQLTQFSKEIIKYTPGTDTHDWEVIATNLNSYLYENKAWHTKYLFFNAADCQEAFRTTLLEPFSLKKDEAAKVKSFKDSVPYIEEVLQVYFTEVDKQWKTFNIEKAWAPVDLEDVQLPKETHRFKLTWILKRIFRLNWLSSFLSFLYCIHVSRNFCPSFRILYLGGVFLFMVRDFQNTRIFFMKMEHKMQFLSTIINEPESGANGWDAIAKKMNRYLFEKKVWRNEEFFFDGIDCEWFFSHFFYRHLSSKKFRSSVSLNVELWPYIREAQLSRSGEF
ncbi:CPA_1a_G0017710.mRNA.1.CDS.1 [Saccharomyces cerevisiae]|nr:CPA_1a_G0017710.mRNA.1.CDS.1 [Saccharomyces cerevisiae]CAI4453739.1 BBM_1a_G0017600.mRNA.1.CDS.1 [Saccharomyces cerevisiae]CAI7111170.1 BBM_1a_G0017600.mRNA.1.CDS.1 [Saccharomyces cerevisiae]CAI7281536.1 CPA_1a_G0017710.mRNA.1.CDS.1 [Saccharomyces cerevisiae]